MNPETEINVLLKQSGAIQLESALNTYRLPSGRMWIKPKTYNQHAKQRVLNNLKRFIEEEKRVPGKPNQNALPRSELINVTPEMAKQWNSTA